MGVHSWFASAFVRLNLLTGRSRVYETLCVSIIRKVGTTLWGVSRHPLHRDAKFLAMWTYCVRQIGARLVAEEVCVGFPNETRLLLNPRMKGEAQFLFPKLGEFGDMGFLLHYLRPNDLFVDVGANIGAYTVLAAGVVGAQAVAFEPSPVTYARLTANVRLNNVEARVKTINVAVGRAAGTLEFTSGLGTENYVATSQSLAARVQVPVVTLDEVLADSPPKLMKVDVEGFETEVFAGGAGLLGNKHMQALIVERGENASRYGFDEGKLHDQIKNAGFIACGYDPLTRVIQRLPPDALGNIIYLRSPESSQALVREAPLVTLDGSKF